LEWPWSKVGWNFEVEICPPRKRKWLGCIDTDDYNYRKLDWDDRRKYALQKYLEYATEDEIMATLAELWESLKPTKDLLVHVIPGFKNHV
jgi:hypothetical protein